MKTTRNGILYIHKETDLYKSVLTYASSLANEIKKNQGISVKSLHMEPNGATSVLKGLVAETDKFVKIEMSNPVCYEYNHLYFELKKYCGVPVYRFDIELLNGNHSLNDCLVKISHGRFKNHGKVWFRLLII